MNLTLNHLEDTIIDFGDIVSDNIKSHEQFIYLESSHSKISKSQRDKSQRSEQRTPNGPIGYMGQGEGDINNFLDIEGQVGSEGFIGGEG
jgi:hypothetical protein